MQTEQDTQFSEQRNHLVELLGDLLADPTDTWQIAIYGDGFTEVSRRISARPDNRQDGVVVGIKFVAARVRGTLRVEIDGVQISLSLGAADTISVMVARFCKRHQDDKITAKLAKEATAIEALARACAVMRVSGGTKA